MKFKKYLGLENKHAFLSPSKPHWVNYNDERLKDVYFNHLAALKGTELHEHAHKCITLRTRLERSKTKSLNMYINDAIGFKMESEQRLCYSDNCFGTADSICFKKNKLRIHDLKTGVTKASHKQLEIYTALFCLDYGKHPNDIDIELRIYQNGEIDIWEPEKEEILYIMEKIKKFDELINTLRED
jgi:hypothetical protein